MYKILDIILSILLLSIPIILTITTLYLGYLIHPLLGLGMAIMILLYILIIIK